MAPLTDDILVGFLTIALVLLCYLATLWGSNPYKDNTRPEDDNQKE